MAITSAFGGKSKMPKPRHPNETAMIIPTSTQRSPKQLPTTQQTKETKRGARLCCCAAATRSVWCCCAAKNTRLSKMATGAPTSRCVRGFKLCSA